MSEYSHEMTEEEIKEQKRAELMARINELMELITKLNEYKQQLSEQEEKSCSEVYTPACNYDLTVATDIKHWAGELEQLGERKRENITGAVDGFNMQIEAVISEIDGVIQEIQLEIDDLMGQLAKL